MKNLIINLTQQQYNLACRRLLDPQAHLQNFADCMVHNAMQERGYAPQADNNYSDADIAAVLALPTVKQTEDLRKEQEALAQAAAAKQKALDEKAVADSQADAARKEAAQLQADAEQRQADIKAAAKKLLEDAMPDLRASLIAELKLQPAA
jgi:uncharacterized membrane protein YqiK